MKTILIDEDLQLFGIYGNASGVADKAMAIRRLANTIRRLVAAGETVIVKSRPSIVTLFDKSNS